MSRRHRRIAQPVITGRKRASSAVRVRIRHEKEIPLARRQHAIEEKFRPSSSSRSVRLGVPQRRDKRKKAYCRAGDPTLPVVDEYTINEGPAPLSSAAPRSPCAMKRSRSSRMPGLRRTR
jgi:hypothetical protein